MPLLALARKMDLIKLNPKDQKIAAKVCARAFFDYPMITFIWPDRRRRERYLEWYFLCALIYGQRYGSVFTTSEISGVSIWLPPARPYLSLWRSMRAGFYRLPRAIGYRNYIERELKNEAAVMRAHQACMPGPHWYLWAIAVCPDKQGRGVGSSLLVPGLMSADADKLPAYLETHDEKNLRFYQKHGFEMIRTELVPGTNLRFWCLKREAIFSN